MPGEDALCNWVDIVQNDDDDNSFPLAVQPSVPTSPNTGLYSGLIPDPVNSILHRRKMKRSDKLSCPPTKGKAQITSTILLLGGYVPEAKFTVKVKATAEGVGGKEANLHKRQVPQEHSHEKFLNTARVSLAVNNPAGIADPVFGLLGSADKCKANGDALSACAKGQQAAAKATGQAAADAFNAEFA
ncbi:MAG: hypothetical protein M1812_002770 [Candelaria pacifica]|nr:MAG: hypothetical protein M1812_002770 [Candelaria pacifica]